MSYGLHFPADNSLQIKVFSDSDWGGDPNDRKSVGAYSLLLCLAGISWKSKKKHVTSWNSVETKYRALADASWEIFWVIKLLSDLQHSVPHPIPLLGDNQATIDLTANQVYHSRTKHVELDCHFIHEKIVHGLNTFVKVNTKHNASDILTKGLIQIGITLDVIMNWDGHCHHLSLLFQFMGGFECIWQRGV